MASSKKDFYIVSKLFTDLINNLSEDQFSNLINGMADIRYFEKNLDSEKREIYDSMLRELALEDNEERKYSFIRNSDELSTKIKLIEFCKYARIEFKSKDTNDTIIQNIINFTSLNKESILYKFNRVDGIEVEIDKIVIKLEDTMDIEEARNLIYGSKVIENKSNLLKVAKKLNVFVDREATYDIIVDTIIKSVVEAKIRSYTIRKKL